MVEMAYVAHPIRSTLVISVALLAALVASAPAGAAGAVDSMFTPGAEFAVGKYPHSVTSADFDGDGNPDLATANADSHSVSVLLGDGSGGFGPKTDFTVGNYPSSVTAADFDGDGNPDLATANYFSNSVSILLGDGNGGFEPKTDFTVGLYPHSVTASDFDGDGNLDIATAYGVSNSVSVRLGDGNGGFGPKTDFTVDSYPYALTSADFDGDGNADLATVSVLAPGTVSVLLGDGNGAFGPATDFNLDEQEPLSVTSADFDGDGNSDLATADFRQPSSVSVLLGDGSGGFGPKTDFTVGGGPEEVISADFDGDGDPDAATANSDAATVSVLLGTGSGAFGSRSDLTVRFHPDSLTSTDFDGDGNPDLATANGGSDSVSILLGTGAPSLTIAKRPKARIKTERKQAKVRVTFISEDSGASFRCRLDAAAYEPCASPFEVKAKSKPGKGMEHKISIEATDEAGNVGGPAAVKFKVIREGVQGEATAAKAQEQSGGRIAVRAEVRAKEDLHAVATGKVKTRRRDGCLVGRASDPKPCKVGFKLLRVDENVGSGNRKTLKLEATAAGNRRLVKLVDKGRKAKAKLRIKLADRAGNKETTKLQVKLKPLG
jgi:hypothetical protein